MTQRVNSSSSVDVPQVPVQGPEAASSSASWVPGWIAENRTFLQVLSYLTPNGYEPDMLLAWRNERAFMQALQDGDHTTARLFAESLDPRKMCGGKSLLDHALEHNSIDVIFYFLRNHTLSGEEIQRISHKIASRLPGSPGSLRDEYREDIDHLIERGGAEVLLQSAIMGENAQWVQYLLPKMTLNQDDYTNILTLVLEWGSPDESAALLLLDLVEKGAAISEEKIEPFLEHLLSVYQKALRAPGDLATVRAIRTHFPLVRTTSDLLIACEGGNVPLIKFLINDGVNLPAPAHLEPGQKTPAQVFQAASDAVKVLMLEAGYQPSDRHYATPALLLQAVEMEMPEAILILLKAGVNMDTYMPARAGEEGGSILEIACRKGKARALSAFFRYYTNSLESGGAPILASKATKLLHLVLRSASPNYAATLCKIIPSVNIFIKVDGKSAIDLMLENLQKALAIGQGNDPSNTRARNRFLAALREHNPEQADRFLWELRKRKIKEAQGLIQVVLQEGAKGRQLTSQDRQEVSKIFTFLRENSTNIPFAVRKCLLNECLLVFRGRMQDAVMHMFENGLDHFGLLIPALTSADNRTRDAGIAQTDRVSVLATVNPQRQIDKILQKQEEFLCWNRLNPQAGASIQFEMAAIREQLSRLKIRAGQLQASSCFIGLEKALLDDYAQDIDNYIAFCHQMEEYIAQATATGL